MALMDKVGAKKGDVVLIVADKDKVTLLRYWEH